MPDIPSWLQGWLLIAGCIAAAGLALYFLPYFTGDREW